MAGEQLRSASRRAGAAAIALATISTIAAAATLVTLPACRTREAPPVPPSPLRAPSVEEGMGPLPRDRPLRIVLRTSEGEVHCRIDPAKAPRAAAMFTGLASGRAAWREPRSGKVVRRPYYRDMAIFRAIPDLLFQTGCPIGDGTGTPGYRIPVESDAGDSDRLAQPGALFLARYNPPPNRVDPNPPPAGEVIGSQLVISLGAMSHLAGQVTVIGQCDDLEAVRGISRLVANKVRAVKLTDIELPGAPVN